MGIMMARCVVSRKKSCSLFDVGFWTVAKLTRAIFTIGPRATSPRQPPFFSMDPPKSNSPVRHHCTLGDVWVCLGVWMLSSYILPSTYSTDVEKPHRYILTGFRPSDWLSSNTKMRHHALGLSGLIVSGTEDPLGRSNLTHPAHPNHHLPIPHIEVFKVLDDNALDKMGS